MRRNALAVILLALSAASAAQPPKEPWKWTLEERLQARFDPAARKARLRKSAGADIDGNVHPELFLPVELFESLVYMHVRSPEWFVMHVASRSDDVLRTSAERRTFARLTRRYGELLLRERALIDASSRATTAEKRRLADELAALRRERPAAERSALTSVRNAFGRERFDRFLYLTMAPGRATSVAPGNPDDVTREALRRREEGLQ